MCPNIFKLVNRQQWTILDGQLQLRIVTKEKDIAVESCIIVVPILVDSCPFEVANNWNQLSADCSQTILTKDAKTLCKYCFSTRIKSDYSDNKNNTYANK